jgi:hypothetical protein
LTLGGYVSLYVVCGAQTGCTGSTVWSVSHYPWAPQNLFHTKRGGLTQTLWVTEIAHPQSVVLRLPIEGHTLEIQKNYSTLNPSRTGAGYFQSRCLSKISIWSLYVPGWELNIFAVLCCIQGHADAMLVNGMTVGYIRILARNTKHVFANFWRVLACN